MMVKGENWAGGGSEKLGGSKEPENRGEGWSWN